GTTPLLGVVLVSAGVCLSQGFGLLSESLTGGLQFSPLVDEALRIPFQALARLLQLSSVLSMRHAKTPSWGDEQENSVHTSKTSDGWAKAGLYLRGRYDDGQDSHTNFPHVNACLTHRHHIYP